jgi:glycosyltransferase involved in cell wall biosynthesis
MMQLSGKKSRATLKIAIDAVGIRGHGGAAVLCELLLWLPKVRPDWEWYVFILSRNLREFDDPAVSDKVTFEHMDSGNKGVSRLLWVNYSLPKRLEKIKADVLFSFANMAPSRPRIPQIVYCHQANAFLPKGLPIYAILKRARWWFMRHQILRSTRASHAVIVQTESMRQTIAKVAPRLREHIQVIPCGYRTPSGNPIVRPEKASLIVNASRPRLIYVSHPSEHKNHVTLVRALPDIVAAIPSACLLLTLAKERTDQYDYYVKMLQAEAVSLGVEKHIVWLGDITSDEVEFALRSSDLSVFPSLSESFGLGLVESMAAGCPVAASNMPYAHDVAGDAAEYFDPTSPKSLSVSILKVLTSTGCLGDLRDRGLQKSGLYRYDGIAETMALLFEKTRTQGGL